MNFLSIGAGAIGTYIGGSLTLSGNQVVYLEKPGARASIESLHLNLIDQTHTISNPTIVTNIEEAIEFGPYDCVLFALKSFDTIRVLKSIVPFIDQLPPFLCLQNGVENELNMRKYLQDNQVIPATVTSAIGKISPGSIVLEKLRGIGISNQHPLSSRLLSAFNLSNLNAQLYQNPEAMKWSKLLTNLVSNATSAILALPPEEIFSHPGLYKIERAQLNETLDVMEKSKIPVVDLPGTPVRQLALAVRWIPSIISRPLIKKAVVGGRGDKMPSFYLDLMSGRTESEVDFLNGAVVRWGEKVNIPTPVNSFLTITLAGMVNGRISKERYQNNIQLFIDNFNKNSD